MLAGCAQSLNRRALNGLPIIVLRAAQTARRGLLLEEEKPMKRCLLLTCGIVALLASHMPASAQTQGAKGKNCRMEQQCHWENFKKICVYVKVCR